jgi:hypothetical protein
MTKPRIRVTNNGSLVTLFRADGWCLVFSWHDFPSPAEAWENAMIWYRGGVTDKYGP